MEMDRLAEVLKKEKTASGEKTILRLEVKQCHGRTAITDCYYTSPLKIGTPNSYGEVRKVVLMMASAGVLKGDCFDYRIQCGAGTRTEVTEQSYTKLFDMRIDPHGNEYGMASRNCRISVDEGAFLYYHPCAVIPFAGSCFEGRTWISLKESSIFCFGEILAAGRIAMGERFAFHSYQSRIQVEIEGIPVYLEQSLLRPSEQKLRQLFYFDNYSHQGSFYFYLPNPEEEQRLAEEIPELIQEYQQHYQMKEEELLYGISAARRGWTVKILAGNAQEIEQIFELIANRIVNKVK